MSQSPIAVFKASTVLQSLGIMASKILLLSSDVKGGKKNRTYCPSTWNGAYTYGTQAEYSGQLRMAEEYILGVVAQLSNKNTNHPKCAFADSDSSVLTGMMVSLVPGYKAKVSRPVQISDPMEFESFDHLHQVLNESLPKHQISKLFQHLEQNVESCTFPRVPGTSSMSTAQSRSVRILSITLTSSKACLWASLDLGHQRDEVRAAHGVESAN